MKKILTTTLALAALAASANGATVLEDWQFNDAVGTTLPSLTKDAGLATFSNADNVLADGAGNIEYTQGATTSDNVFRNATVTTATSGIFQLEFTITSATLSGGDATGANVGYGARDSGAGTDLFLLRLHKQNDSYRLQTRIGGTNTTLDNFGTTVATSLSDLAIRAVFDLDADTMDVFWTLGGGAESSSLNIVITDGTFDALRLFANTNSVDFGAADTVTVDNLVLSSVPEPSSAALLGLGGLALIFRRRK